MTANPDDDPAHPVTSPGSATRPARTCLTPAAPIGPTLAHMTPGDRAEVVAILGHLGDPREDSSDDEARDRGPAQFSTTLGIVRWPSSVPLLIITRPNSASPVLSAVTFRNRIQVITAVNRGPTRGPDHP
jgi:hypothetical protein